jgi:DNA-binding XRE family transcriptional regulator
MDERRLGDSIRTLRRRRGWRQRDLASAARVSDSTVSRIERGMLRQFSWETVVRVADALEMRIDLVPRWRGGELTRLLNARHSALHESVARSLVGVGGWILSPEVSFSVYGERGIIDILAWHPATGTLLVIELKTEIVDIQEMVGTLDRKRRLAPGIARTRGWSPRSTGIWLIVADSSTDRRRVAAHRTMLRAAFPVDGRQMRTWLRQPTGAVSCLSFWSDLQPQTARRFVRACSPGRPARRHHS